MTADDDNPRPAKRARKSCERCRQRKQRCHGYPQCSNCASAKVECKQPASAIEEYRSGPNQALLERISFLEAQLATYASATPPGQTFASWTPSRDGGNTPRSATTKLEDQKTGIADVVGFLGLGGEGAYVGPSSGISLAANLEQMVQATVWNKALASTMNNPDQPKIVSLADVKKNSAGPPNDEVGARILDAYFTRTHDRYPFLDRVDIMERHAMRFSTTNSTAADQFGTFKIYMIYAIGATLLKLTEAYDYTPPENFFMTALQHISAARESHSVHNIQAMTLLVLYSLRSPSNSGIWYMIGLAMRTSVDIGLHREAHYSRISPYEGQLRRRLFWSIYYLERTIAISHGRPYSISDRDIDVGLPLEIDDTVRDDELIARAQAAAPSPTFQESWPFSNLTLGIQCISLMRLESHIQSTLYRVDEPLASLVPEIMPIIKLLDNWHSTLPRLPLAEKDYLDMHYYKALRLAIQPFLNLLPPDDPCISICLHASGQISQIFKRMHQRDSYGHSFIALHSVFIAGVTMCYCLFLAPSLWTFSVSNDLRACSSALFVMAERTPVVKKYRDALEVIIGSTMEFMTRASDPKEPSSNNNNNNDTSPPRPSHSSTHPHADLCPIPPRSTAPDAIPRDVIHKSTTTTLATTTTTTTAHPPTPYQTSYAIHPHNFLSADLDYGAAYTPFPYDAAQPSDQAAGYESPGGGGGGAGAGANADGGGSLDTGIDGGAQGAADAEWLLSLCEGDGYGLQMLNDMMKFEPSMGA